MGLSGETALTYGLRDKHAPVPDTIEVRKAAQSIRGTVQNIFRNGAFITSDGRTIYFGVNEMTVPKELLEDFRLGRITECNPREKMPKDSRIASRLRMFIVPPDSHRKLIYHEGPNEGLDIWLLHGLKDDGTSLADNLYTTVGRPIQAFLALAKHRLETHGIPADMHSPKRIVNEALRDLALEEGLGEKEAAVKKMKEEMLLTAQEAEDFLRGK